MTEKNMTMLCDFYELTMANGYFKNGFYKKLHILMYSIVLYLTMVVLQL